MQKKGHIMNLNTPICAIVAVGPENVIGKDNVMPWHCPADLRHFKLTTLYHPCIFGKNTFAGMGNQPLKDRLNIVCSSQYKDEMINYRHWHASSVESAINTLINYYDKIFVCGGAQIYKYVLDRDLIDVFYLTKIESPELRKQVLQNSKQYTYFPVDVNTFFSPDKWTGEQITYPVDTLPKNPPQVKQTFWKYTRIRNNKTR